MTGFEYRKAKGDSFSRAMVVDIALRTTPGVDKKGGQEIDLEEARDWKEWPLSGFKGEKPRARLDTLRLFRQECCCAFSVGALLIWQTILTELGPAVVIGSVDDMYQQAYRAPLLSYS